MATLFISIESCAPSSGLSVARVLRRGLPDVSLVAVSRAPHGPVVHSDVFDDAWTVPSWEALDLDAHAAEIESRLENDAFYLPTDPEEARWLSAQLAPCAHLLGPSPPPLAQTSGLHPDAVAPLPLSVPEGKPLTAPVDVLHALGRRHDWSLWMRALSGERRALDHWTQFERAYRQMEDRGLDALVLQRRVDGSPRFLPFSARQGTLLASAFVRPCASSAETYRVEAVPHPLHRALTDCLHDLGWTGGGSLRLIDDGEGTLWFDGWRPCFDAQVEGVARCGKNLPAQLVSAVTGAEPSTPSSSHSRFGWLSTATALPDASAPSEAFVSSAFPPSSSRPRPDRKEFTDRPTDDPDEDLQKIVDDLPPDWAACDTPRFHLLPTRSRERFNAFATAADRIERGLDLDTARVGLSIKTNPAEALLERARANDMLAETIHPDEMTHAQRHGFDPGDLVVNGPVQALLNDLDGAPFALFGDAVQDLHDLPFDPAASILGVRTRPPERGRSRFGVDLSASATMDRLCDQLQSLPGATRLGLHLHAPSSTLGHSRWWRCVDRVLEWAQTIQTRTGRSLRALDLGGGWHPDDWLDVFVPELLERRDAIREALPQLEVLLLEPGKALSQPLGVVLSRVLDARPSRSEVILDASLAELSNIDYHPHRLLAHTSNRGWHRLPRGEGTLLGRLCMEADILGRHRTVDHLSPGDTVVVCDAGAYDMSMAYPFGRGQSFADERAGEKWVL